MKSHITGLRYSIIKWELSDIIDVDIELALALVLEFKFCNQKFKTISTKYLHVIAHLRYKHIVNTLFKKHQRNEFNGYPIHTNIN